MTPEELKAYLDVVKGSGLTFSRLEVTGKLVVESMTASGGERVTEGAPKHPAVQAIEELFPNGLPRPGA